MTSSDGDADDDADVDAVVDAHLHLWDLTAAGDYAWNTPALGPAHATFGAADAEAALASAGVGRAVLVQAADTVGDSERMLAAAAAHAWAAGVVAWVPLQDPVAAERLLDRWAATGRVVGVRQLLHDDADPERLDDARVRTTLAMLAAQGLPLDVPDAWPRLWPALRRLLDAVPGLVVVLDHLGKPALGLDARGRPADAEAYAAWQRGLRAVAGHPAAVAKLSGLDAPLGDGVRPTPTSVRPLVETALAAFGPERLMVGGDWPMSLRHGSYAHVLGAIRGALDDLGTDERRAVLSGTARRVYGLPG